MSFTSAWCAFKSALKGSPNVWRIMLFTFLYNCALAVWMTAIWPPFLKAVFHTNSSLGWVACSSGIAGLLAAVSSGLASDKIGRNVVLRIAAVTMALASAGMAASIYFEHFASVIVAGAGAGAAYGAFFPVVEAVFADSVPAGHRTAVYSIKFNLETASGVLGVIVAIVMFVVMGDSWDILTMKVVIWSGLGLTGACSVLLWTVRSEYALEQLNDSNDSSPPTASENPDADGGDRGGVGSTDGSESNRVDIPNGDVNGNAVAGDPNLLDADAAGAMATLTEPLLLNNDSGLDNDGGISSHFKGANAVKPAGEKAADSKLCTLTSDALPQRVNERRDGPDSVRTNSSLSVREDDESRRTQSSRTAIEATNADTDEANGDDDAPPTTMIAGYNAQRCSFLHVPLRVTPYLLSSIGVCICLGSGMTVMFFNLFLIQEFETSPVVIQILQGLTSLLNVAFAQLLALADSCGCNRFRIQIPPIAIGVIGIGILAGVSSGPLAAMWPTYVIFTLRKAAMNCCTGIVRALMMDIVSKAQRGRWNALESLMGATWAASAVVGGYVADASSYRHAFMITFAFHGAALGILVLMFRNRDPREWLEKKAGATNHN